MSMVVTMNHTDTMQTLNDAPSELLQSTLHHTESVAWTLTGNEHIKYMSLCVLIRRVLTKRNLMIEIPA